MNLLKKSGLLILLLLFLFMSVTAASAATVQGSPQTFATLTTPITGMGAVSSGNIVANLPSAPNVTASWSAIINNQTSPGAQVVTSIQDVPDAYTLALFRTTLAGTGNDIGSVAYVMVARKVGWSGATGPATVIMTAPQSWVSMYGTSAITIVRYSDVSGTGEVLSTHLTGYDSVSGYPTFQAASPNGLSTFALVGEVPLPITPPPAVTQAAQMAPPQAQPSSLGVSSSGLAILEIEIAVIGGAVVIVGAAAVAVLARKK